VASNERTEDGDGWRHMVGWRTVASNERTEDGDGWRQMIRRRMGTDGVIC